VDNRSADDRPAPVRFTSVIPLRVTLEVGTPYVDSGSGSSAQSSAVDSDEMIVEGVVADYADRSGYDAEFLGLSLDIPLPDVTNAADVLTFSTNGRPERVLRYEHFSVVMSKSRRMCRYSAVNVRRKTTREGRTNTMAHRSAYPQGRTDQQRMLWKRAQVLARSHDAARGSRLGCTISRLARQ
jgi:hypothetical protein